ncbi:MAG: helix-turn-helix domain-containing protein [Planctomycetia bacterium]|nr:helix-turn-helix domain-containing protein [Planctomycetia bacterium]
MHFAPAAGRRVAVVIEASNAYARGLLAGIHRHVREHEPWTIFLPEHGRGFPPLEPLARWRGDGVIARIETAAIARTLAALRRRQKLAIVDVSAGRLLSDTPYVETDDAAIARLAAEHFIERDFRHFAVLAPAEAVVAGTGRSVAVYRSPGRRGTRPADDDEPIEAWLGALPKPVGLLACYDIRGRQALDACRRAGIAVPDEVAVLGVDDDELLCGLATPPLSSVIPDAVGAGRLAAGLLERLMRGERLEKDEWLLPPLGIASRQSSDALAIDDLLVVAAVRFIRERATAGLKVQDVVRKLDTTRRILDGRFLARLGHSPHEEIARHQFRRVEQLLAETDLPLATVAERSGFRHAEYMTVAFTKRYGTPPSRWRQARRR